MNFLGIGPLELVIIMVVALVIFGPQRLPEIGAQIGKAIRDFRQMTNDVTGEFQRTMTLDTPPPPAALAPDAPAQEASGAAAQANGAGSADTTEFTAQTIVSDLPDTIAAEDPWAPPAETAAADAAPPVATKADPHAGASLLDLTPATKSALSANGAGGGDVPPDTTVTYTPAATTDGAAAAQASAPAAVPASFPAYPPSVANEAAGDASAASGSSVSDAWDAVVNTEATLPRAAEEPAAPAATDATPAPIPYAYTPPAREPVDQDAEVTIREKIEAQVAAEAFRERRRVASYNRPRKRA